VPSPLRTLLGLPERALVVSIPSGGAPIKGLRYLCEIARGLAVASPIGVYVSGYVSDDIRWELEQLAPRVRCFLPGHVGYDVNLAHVAACDLTVSPTLIENLSNALVESILLGVPVVTFDTGGNSEIIEAGRTGVIVGHADVEGLIREVRCLITSPAALQALRSACAPNARRLIDPSAIERVFEDVFDLIHPPVRGGA
jgi:glycosyltransferase involved in cell wall biosynthesis